MLLLTNYIMYFCSGLLNVLDSDQFDSEFDFLSKYGDLKNAEQVACGKQTYFLYSLTVCILENNKCLLR
jgi:hypothetical protein